MSGSILIAVDGSEHATKAIAIAADLAAVHDAELVLLHVASASRAPDETVRMAEAEHLVPKGTGEGIDPQTLRRMPHLASIGQPEGADRVALGRAFGERLLQESAAQAAGAGAPRVRTLLEFGDPADLIVAAAKRERPDAVVLGSRGLGTFRGMMLGSVSREVASKVRCTCITVH